MYIHSQNIGNIQHALHNAYRMLVYKDCIKVSQI